MNLLNCFSSVTLASVKSISSNCLIKQLLLFVFFALTSPTATAAFTLAGARQDVPPCVAPSSSSVTLEDWIGHFLLHSQLNGSWLIMKRQRLAVNVLAWRFARRMGGICGSKSQVIPLGLQGHLIQVSPPPQHPLQRDLSLGVHLLLPLLGVPAVDGPG